MMTPARVERRTPPETGRIIAISDIHANLDYLKGLLKKLAPAPEDTLVFCGDFLEKGPRSLDTLHFLMELRERQRCWFVLGNCDYWYDDADHTRPCTDWYVKDYLISNGRGQGPGLLAQMCESVGFPITPELDMREFSDALKAGFAREFEFLAEMPQVIETEHYFFVHGGLPRGPRESWGFWHCMKNDNFMNQGLKFDKWVIAGHWPVVLYHEHITDAKPIIDRGSHIISIDGGCVLKDDGQLNALIIPPGGGDEFECAYYDPFPTARALEAQSASEKSYYIRWGDSAVEPLSFDGEFTRCRHLRTGYVMDIPSDYVRVSERGFTVNDCTDYRLPVEPGDLLSVVKRTSRGCLCKKNGVSGWYAGKLEPVGD